MNKSIWADMSKIKEYEKLKKDINCEVLVVGGGIAGILSAYFLQQAGKDVVLVEAKKIGAGITKNTTAVLTAQHDTPYYELIKMHGKKRARKYLDANLQAVETFREMAKKIDCDFKEKPSYMYSKNKNLKKEQKALLKLGYECTLTNKTGLPFEVKSAVKFSKMAEFHPLKFLYQIAKDIKIYENTLVTKIEKHTAFTEKNKINFKKCIVATHFPFINRTGWFFVKMYQERSYVIALENAKDVKGTYIEDIESGFYFRNYENLLLVGKGDHRTGTKTKAFEELEQFATEYFPNCKILYKWANQDCVTLDNMPYVGKYGHLKDVYTLSGFNLWGMTGSMVGAKILTDLICENENEFAKVFKTKRCIWHTQLFKNLGVVMKNIVYPTTKRCPHLGCALVYNKCEHSWDCQCHGSRFEKDGKLIDNPAMKDAKV